MPFHRSFSTVAAVTVLWSRLNTLIWFLCLDCAFQMIDMEGFLGRQC